MLDISVTCCSSASRTGHSHGREKSQNQDSLLVCKLDIPHEPYLFLVCDGHGEFGHSVSSYIAKILPCFLLEGLERRAGASVMQDALFSAYQKTNESLKDADIDALFSGSTCVSAVVHRNNLICASVGDSRAVIGRMKGKGVTALPVSRDHSPADPRERERVAMAGGRIAAASDPCLRIWYADQDLPGLAVTRAIGDFGSSCIGLIATPDTMCTALTDSDLFLILASDGVWEYISSQEAVELVYAQLLSGSQTTAAHALVSAAGERWAQKSHRADDITAVVCFFG